MISENEKKYRKHEKELKSFRNRMNGINLVWFDSLSLSRKYDLLFEWKAEKYSNNLKKPKVIYVKRGIKLVKIIKYPPNLKHFINKRRGFGKWRVNLVSIRNSAIDILLKNKI